MLPLELAGTFQIDHVSKSVHEREKQGISKVSLNLVEQKTAEI